MENKKIVIALSGGMDSATLLGYFIEKGYEVTCCHFQYGSKHNRYEENAIQALYEFYSKKSLPVFFLDFNLSSIFSKVQSSLLLTGGDIPEGHYNDDNMKKTVVSGRNLIFLSILAAIAESKNINAIALGVHSGDHHIYPDCRPNFIHLAGQTIKSSTDNRVSVHAPFLYLDKTHILKLGHSFTVPVPYQLTRTCYKNQPISCGKCGSCVERLEAFKNMNLIDRIMYEN